MNSPDLLAHHRTNLKVYDDLISLMKNHSSEHKLKFLPTSLMNRESFLKKLETCLESTSLKPRDVTVNLAKGAMATVTVFDLQAMILSLLFDKSLMKSKNMVEGYDLLTGFQRTTKKHFTRAKPQHVLQHFYQTMVFLYTPTLSFCPFGYPVNSAYCFFHCWSSKQHIFPLVCIVKL